MSSTQNSVEEAPSIRKGMARPLVYLFMVCSCSWVPDACSKLISILVFKGSALYIFGDKTDRHGLFTVTLDNHTPELFNGVSGCGGAFSHACEKDNTLAYFASNLDFSLHTVTVRNIAGINGSFFGKSLTFFSHIIAVTVHLLRSRLHYIYHSIQICCSWAKFEYSSGHIWWSVTLLCCT